MIEEKLGLIITFGTTTRYLQDVQAGFEIQGDLRLIFNIKQFLERLDRFGLHVTKRASVNLVKFLAELEKGTETKTSAKHAARLNAIMLEIRPTLIAEARGKVVYIVSERRFAIERLVDDISPLFAGGVFSLLPPLAQNDFSEAGKCLAFERPTAAAFHMLRATEAVLKQYYCEKVKRNRATLMWGPIIQSMRSMPKRFPLPLLNHLDHIRSGFRNPTAHPEKIFEMDEAQDLLSICIDVSNRMVQVPEN